MSYIANCLYGLEEITEKETKGKKILSERIEFKKLFRKKLQQKQKKVRKEKTGSYQFKSVIRIYKLIKRFNFKDINEILDNFKKLKIKIKGSFKIDCNREGEHNFKSVDVEKILGIYLQKNSYKLDFKEPKTIIFVDILDDNCLIGLLENDNLQKREYRVKLNPDTLNPCIAYAALSLINYKKGDILVDPLCRDGIVVIEAAVMKKGKVYGFDKNTRNARINSKIANVKVELFQNEIDWLDTKFKKNSVKVASYLPSLSKRNKEQDIRKFYSELFHQLNYIVKDKIALIVKKSDLIKNYFDKFKLIKELKISIGDDNFYILVLNKKL